MYVIHFTDTLGLLARSLGSEHFSPLAQETVQLGLGLLTKTDDPELRKSCYRLFSSLSTVLKGEMKSILPALVEMMLNSLKSVEGVVVSKIFLHFYYDHYVSMLQIKEELLWLVSISFNGFENEKHFASLSRNKVQF